MTYYTSPKKDNARGRTLHDILLCHSGLRIHLKFLKVKRGKEKTGDATACTID